MDEDKRFTWIPYFKELFEQLLNNYKIDKDETINSIKKVMKEIYNDSIRDFRNKEQKWIIDNRISNPMFLSIFIMIAYNCSESLKSIFEIISKTFNIKKPISDISFSGFPTGPAANYQIYCDENIINDIAEKQNNFWEFFVHLMNNQFDKTNYEIIGKTKHIGGSLLSSFLYLIKPQKYIYISKNVFKRLSKNSNFSINCQNKGLKLYDQSNNNWVNMPSADQYITLLEVIEIVYPNKNIYELVFESIEEDLQNSLKNINLLSSENEKNITNNLNIRYWRVGTRDGETHFDHWEEMKNNNYISIGWEAIGDIKDIETRENIVQKLTELKLYNESHQIIGRKANEIFNFYSVMRIGDIILAQDGYKIRGIGKIDGNYIYQKNLDFPNLRPVKWLFNDNINIINKEGNLTTFIEIKDKNTIDKINNYILGKPSLSRGIKMEHKFLNTILHGAPGTGKTWNTIDRAVAIATKTSLEENISEEKHAEKFEIFNKLLWDGKNKTGQICFITFHQSYSYEEFVEGLKPKTENGNIKYEFEDGIFKQLCDKAKNDSPNNYVLIIDEINRGNVSRIFGELITLIEPDKRENVIKDEDDKTKYNTLRVTLPYSKVQFSVPNNLYIIGTMNTADRSIEALDTALRRRFSFVEYEPKYDLVELKISIDGVSLSEILKTINKRIEILYDRDHWIGHSYFLDVKDKKDLINVFNDKVIPLLKEYFFSDWGKIRLILGNDFIEKEEIKEKKKYFNITDTDYDYSDKILYKLKNTEDDKNNWNFNEFHYSNNETDNN